MDPELAPKEADALSVTPYPDIVCVYCAHRGVQVEEHMTLVAKDPTTGDRADAFSLAGAQMKTVASRQPWPFMRCLGCNHVSRGRR